MEESDAQQFGFCAGSSFSQQNSYLYNVQQMEFTHIDNWPHKIQPRVNGTDYGERVADIKDPTA